MPVATWGYGTGATGTGAHPFSLRIQGVDFIGWVPIDSIRVSSSNRSNATMDFDIVQPPAIGSIPFTPFAYADVYLTDNVAQEVVFAGILVGLEELGMGVGIGRRVRCVDYGYLLDVCPMTRGILAGKGGGTRIDKPILSVLGCGATSSAITGASVWDTRGELSEFYQTEHGRVLTGIGVSTDYYAYIADDAGTGDPLVAGSMRANLDAVADRASYYTLGVGYSPAGSASPFVVYVDPEQRLNAHPVNYGWTTAGFVIDNDAASGTALKTVTISVERDYTQMASGVFVSDADTSTGGDNSAFYVESLPTTNGYFVCPDSTEAQLASDADVAIAGRRHLSNNGQAILRGELSVVGTVQARVGTKLTVSDARFGLDDTVVIIQAVSTQFLPTTTGARLMTIEWIPQASFAGIKSGSAQRAVRSGITGASTSWTVP